MIKLSPQFIAEFKAFCSDTALCGRSAWVGSKEIAVYVRRANRIFPDLDRVDKKYQVIDIANVSVAEFMQRQGLYSQLLALVVECCPDKAIYIENVHLEEHHGIYLRRGFVQEPNSWSSTSASFYLLPRTK